MRFAIRATQEVVFGKGKVENKYST